ncbi:MAG: TonB-dependent receptor plug domain-containing protein, partial [Prevotella sp.]
MIALKRLATGIVAIFCMTAAAAQDSLRTHTIEDVVVTANKSRTANVFSTIPVQSFSGEDIRLMGLQNIADAVKKFAGTSVKDYGGIGGMKTVSVRNLGAQHTAVSYDGIVVSNTQAGQIDIGRFSLDNVSLLSMAIGQGSDMLQSARHYASAAVMGIMTEQPLLSDKSSLWRIGLSGGSWGQINPKFRLWQRLSESTAMSLNADYMRADGNYPYTLVNGMESTRERRTNSGISQWHVEGNINTLFADSSRLDFKAYYYRSSRGLPGSVILYNNQSNEHLWDENLFAQAIYNKRWNKQWQWVARAKYTHSWNKYEDYNIKYTDGRKEERNSQDEYYASATLNWMPIKWLSMSLAEDASLNKLHTNVNGNPNPLRFTSLTALAAKLRIGRLTADGNLVMTYATESLTESEKYSLKTPEDRKHLTPSLSLSWRILPEEALYLRALYKSTFRMPTFNDLYYLQIGNTSLRPEKAHE